MNQKIKNFEEELITLINSSELPPSVLYYILEAKTIEIGRLFDAAIIKEKYDITSVESEELPKVNVEFVKEDNE